MPIAARANITIGSSLQSTPALGGYNCNSLQQCTVMSPVLDPGASAVGGVASPVNGSVVQFNVKSGPVESQAIRFRVIRQVGAAFVGAGTSGTYTPPVNTTSGFGVAMPIQIGDKIGAECCQNGNNTIIANPVGASTDLIWGTVANPPLADGGPPQSPDSGHPNTELLVSARIVPDNKFSLGAIKRHGQKRGRATIVATLPNPGKVVLRGLGSGKRLVKVTKAAVGEPRKIHLVIKGTHAALKRIRKHGKAKIKIKVRFTPTYGNSRTKTAKGKLK